MGNTKIDYVTKTWNPIEGCAHCSPGCDRCWAKRFVNRAAQNPVFIHGYDLECDGYQGLPANQYERIKQWDGTLTEFPNRWEEPLHWRKPQRILVGSRSDIALWPVPDLERVQHMGYETELHRFLWLTKRAEMLAEKIKYLGNNLPPNIFIGATVCNQEEADEKIPQLLQIPAAGYWLSVEPMLGPIDLAYTCFNGADSFGSMPGIKWVVCGGESGKGARQMMPEWALILRDQCLSAGVPFWFKQWGDAYMGILKDDKIAGYEYHELPDAMKMEVDAAPHLRGGAPAEPRKIGGACST